jgi:hypothetical protein
VVIVINNTVINKWAYIRGGGAYIWNEVSVCTCGGFIHRGTYIRGGSLYSEVYGIAVSYMTRFYKYIWKIV